MLLKHGADPFHKLKDNSTILIEATKGGHLNIVQLLLDYPEKKAARKAVTNKYTQKNKSKLRSILHKVDNDLQQISPSNSQQNQIKNPQNITIQKILSGPLLNAASKPTPETVHITNQDVYQCQMPKTEVHNYDTIVTNPISTNSNTTSLDPSTINPSIDLQTSMTDNMKTLQNQGFKDGLAFGLSHFGLVNGSTVFNNIQNENRSTTGLSSSNSNSTKQKLLLRKNKSNATPFDINPGLENFPQFSLDLKDVSKLNTDKKITDNEPNFLSDRPMVS